MNLFEFGVYSASKALQKVNHWISEFYRFNDLLSFTWKIKHLILFLFSEFPRYSSLRLAYFTVLVTGIVIFAAYSASMISYVTAYVHNLPFRSIEEFVNDGTYDVILNKDSADYDMFAVSLSNNEEFSYDMLSLLLERWDITSQTLCDVIWTIDITQQTRKVWFSERTTNKTRNIVYIHRWFLTTSCYTKI